MSAKQRKYQHEEFRVVLDDCFSNDDIAAALTAGGYVLEQFTDVFPQDGGRLGTREQGVKDRRVIALSHRLKRVVFSTDHRMGVKHRDEFLLNPEAMVVATAHRDGTDEVWVNAFIAARAKIERLHKKQARPWFAKINQKGDFTCCHSFDRIDEEETQQELG